MANILKWYGDKVNQAVLEAGKKVIEQGCVIIESDTKASIGLVPPPAPPGHPPAAPTGALRRSITHDPSEVIAGKIVGRVGTNLEYARRVCLGFVGIDSLGRHYNQAPRPYLRPALEKNRSKIEGLFKDLIK
jgi:hypothetical protein